MKPETEEWVAKADADLATAQREAAVDEAPDFDAVCFHAQQCAEKYLKAVMVESGMRVPHIQRRSSCQQQVDQVGQQRFRQARAAQNYSVYCTLLQRAQCQLGQPLFAHVAEHGREVAAVPAPRREPPREFLERDARSAGRSQRESQNLVSHEDL